MRFQVEVVVSLGCVLLVAPAPGGAQSRRPGVASADQAAARRLDSLGFAAYKLEEDAYIEAGNVTTAYADPEDSQADRHKFFQTSVYLLKLAVRADSTNASATFHYGIVLADRSFKGWGEWNQPELKIALSWLTRASRLATGKYANIRPTIDSTIAKQKEALDHE